jgi:hypothetical protein
LPVVAEVRDLLTAIRERPEPRDRLDLFVDVNMTLDGSQIDHAIGMSIVAGAALSEGLLPRGFTQGERGRVYHYGVGD